MARIRVQFNDELDDLSVPPISAFNVSDNNGNPVDIAAIEISGNSLIIVTDRDVPPGTFILRYIEPSQRPISNKTGYRVGSFGEVYNTDPNKPILVTVQVNGDILTLVYNEDLDIRSVPSADSFRILRFNQR